MPIEKSEAKSWYKDKNSESFAPEKAYDRDYTTFYSVKDGDAEGNYLKLFLSDKHRIDSVVMSNRKKGCCGQRILGTVVMVYSIEGEEETKVADCGAKITGYFFGLELNLRSKQNIRYFYIFDFYLFYQTLYLGTRNSFCEGRAL